MNKENIDRLKRYLFLISIFFSFLIGGHILYIYLYDNAIEKPIEGGSVSEGIIGEFPHLNPLLNSTDYNKDIIYKLYRSLLKYDFKNKALQPDIASCDVKNLNYIECYIENNAKWSNGKDITADDIVATYNIIKNSDINPLMGSLLKETTIASKPGIVTFTTHSKDVNFLQIFFQPIVPKDVLDNIGNKELFGKFNPIDGVYSGPYKVETVSYDDSLGIQKLILSKNENYTKSPVLISKYIYRIFRDTEHFLKHKDIINVFSDKENIIGDSMTRLEKYTYSFNQYMGVFFNEEKIKNYNLRSFLISKIDVNNILKNLGPNYQPVNNPYLLSDVNTKPQPQNINLENTIKEMGFYKKDMLLQDLQNTAKKLLDSAKAKQKVNSDLTYIKGGINKKYTFVSDSNITISGNTKGEKVDEIFINDYKLSSFKKGDNDFVYKLKLDYNNIHLGENNYKLYFVVGGKKVLKEEFIIIFSHDAQKLAKIQDSYFKVDTQVIASQGQTPDNEARKNKILALDDKFYYDYNLNKFSLKLYYIDDISELSGVANTIKNIFATYGIGLDLVPISIADLNKKVTAGEKDYDMLLAGIDLGMFDYNIYPYFHSSQAKNGFNFSNTKNLNLDILLEELRTHVYEPQKRIDLQKKVLDIIADRQIFKTLYKKENSLLVDKNIKNFSLLPSFYSETAIVDALNNAYVSDEKNINFKEKGLYNFLNFLVKVFRHEG